MLHFIEAQLMSSDIHDVVTRLQQVSSMYSQPLEHVRRDVAKVLLLFNCSQCGIIY